MALIEAGRLAATLVHHQQWTVCKLGTGARTRGLSNALKELTLPQGQKTKTRRTNACHYPRKRNSIGY